MFCFTTFCIPALCISWEVVLHTIWDICIHICVLIDVSCILFTILYTFFYHFAYFLPFAWTVKYFHIALMGLRAPWLCWSNYWFVFLQSIYCLYMCLSICLSLFLKILIFMTVFILIDNKSTKSYFYLLKYANLLIRDTFHKRSRYILADFLQF